MSESSHPTQNGPYLKMNESMWTFIEHMLFGFYYAKHFTDIISFN